ncbi:helix-turn-helix transcriptional regulator [Streptomyces sp. AS02]|uniref:helix-turn-helix transcriptional regulator n=1 Tax=Streptomyces sp. AS02 TaxID=2938946 RepID=UPI002020DC8C|nr:helix-turn-helix transcriptional regulator [Streptomyces sp. AS02]MCL8017539.1 helix-turn-helix transcriptional regulator [Streptomyces sp. AS02]
MIEIQGDRWTGKSVLLSRILDEAAGRGWKAVSGYAESRTLPNVAFGVFVEALDDLLAGCHPELLDAWTDGQAAALAAVFPSAPAAEPRGFPADPLERYRVFRAVRALLGSLGADGGLLLGLDNVHWADEASLALLSYLLRHPPQGDTVIALTHRPRQVDLGLRSVLNLAVDAGLTRRLSPPELSDEAACALLPGDLSRTRCVSMLAGSGHNPGLLKAFAATRSLLEAGGHVLPLDVLTESLRDFRGLSDLGRSVAQAASVVGEPCGLDVLQAVAQVTDAELRRAIDELIRQDLLRADESAARLRFSNPLLRAAAYQSAGPGWLLGAHARAAQALSGHGDDSPVILAGHLDRAFTTVSNTDRSRTLLAAATARLWADPARAADWARRALECGGAGGRAESGGVGSLEPHRARLVLGAALVLDGRIGEALQVLQVPRDDRGPASAETVEAVRWRALALRLLGRHPEADAELAAASTAEISQAGRTDGTAPADHVAAEHAEHAAHAAHGALGAPRAGQGAEVADLDAARHGTLLADRLVGQLDACVGAPHGALVTELLGALDALAGAARGRAHALIAAAAVRAGAAEHADLHAVVAARLLDGLSDGVVVPHLDGVFWLAVAESALGRAEEARGHHERGLRIAESRGLRALVPGFAAAVGALDLSRGDVAGAARHAACARYAAAGTDSDRLRQEAGPLCAALAALEDPGPDERPAEVPGSAPPLTPDGASVPRSLGSLSNRETEIAVLVSGGRTNQQIARALAISHKTVETHLGRIFKKLRVSSRAEVAAVVGRAHRPGREAGAA